LDSPYYVSNPFINNNGWITASQAQSEGYFIAFLRDPNGNMTTFDASNGRGHTFPDAINDSNVIAGTYVNVARRTQHEFLRQPDGTFESADFPHADVTFIGGINNASIIVGSFQKGGGTHGYVRLP
jgi:hypothetical protein